MCIRDRYNLQTKKKEQVKAKVTGKINSRENSVDKVRAGGFSKGPVDKGGAAKPNIKAEQAEKLEEVDPEELKRQPIQNGSTKEEGIIGPDGKKENWNISQE
eukprot:TRINITY_DN6931_c0_g1_i1.p1 TRINITY_DN6931_c0_g1~~TRINITY_DN6931_c0_g1_i1.p1  ORF type:complete len:102 (+),score=36.48 TRINITY_DN6931_c0_g1_i1:60-365(+)